MKNIFANKAANQNDTVMADLDRKLNAMAKAPVMRAPAPCRKEAAPKADDNKNDKRDGLLGSLFFDCLFGIPLSDVFGEMAELPNGAPVYSGMAVDCYDEFRRDRTNGRNGDKGVSGSVNNQFNRQSHNTRVREAQEMQAMDSQRQDLADHRAMAARMKRAPGFHMAA